MFAIIGPLGDYLNKIPLGNHFWYPPLEDRRFKVFLVVLAVFFGIAGAILSGTVANDPDEKGSHIGLSISGTICTALGIILAAYSSL